LFLPFFPFCHLYKDYTKKNSIFFFFLCICSNSCNREKEKKSSFPFQEGIFLLTSDGKGGFYVEEFLKNLIKQEQDESKKLTYYTLYKYASQLKPVTDIHDYTPIVYLQNGKIFMIYEEQGIRSLFYNPEEIQIILQMVFNEGQSVFFKYEEIQEVVGYSEEEILKKIDESLQNNDESLFLEYTTLLKKLKK